MFYWVGESNLITLLKIIEPSLCFVNLFFFLIIKWNWETYASSSKLIQYFSATHSWEPERKSGWSINYKLSTLPPSTALWAMSQHQNTRQTIVRTTWTSCNVLVLTPRSKYDYICKSNFWQSDRMMGHPQNKKKIIRVAPVNGW